MNNTFDFKQIKAGYNSFDSPIVRLMVNGKNFTDNTDQLYLSDIDVELTCGFEASVASFHILNSYDQETKQFRTKQLKDYMSLGSMVEIALGYMALARKVFTGFITQVEFISDGISPANVKVTAMDVKSIMMAETNAYQLKAKDYSGAVREILNKPRYQNLISSKAITKLEISDTPDSRQGGGQQDKESAVTVDMVNESDYEFIVRAAKRFNYEFFTECGTVFFRAAKSDKNVLIELGPDSSVSSLHISYDITGIVSTVETRAMDVGRGQLINAKKSASNKLSDGGTADKLIQNTKKVYIDPTVNSQQEAEYRVNSLMETESYRFGQLEANIIGLPELLPGYFIDFKGLGDTVSNRFYLTNVHHMLISGEGFRTSITGKAAALGGDSILGGLPKTVF